MLTPGKVFDRQSSPFKQTPHDTPENVSINAAVAFVSCKPVEKTPVRLDFWRHTVTGIKGNSVELGKWQKRLLHFSPTQKNYLETFLEVDARNTKKICV